jgi:hypothetical protein
MRLLLRMWLADDEELRLKKKKNAMLMEFAAYDY